MRYPPTGDSLADKLAPEPKTLEPQAERVLNTAEKGALGSKKFVAFLVSEIGFFLLLGALIWEQDVNELGGNVAFMTLAVTAGFVATGYILGQAYVDKFVRVTSLVLTRQSGSGNESID